MLDAATFLAGPFCATTMAEFGAEVIKVEHPVVDDPLRKLGTRGQGGETLMYLSEARNKKAITLDLGAPEGAEIFKRMIKKADVVIENFRPGTMERWGLGYDSAECSQSRNRDGPHHRFRAGRTLQGSPWLCSNRACVQRSHLPRRRVRRKTLAAGRDGTGGLHLRPLWINRRADGIAASEISRVSGQYIDVALYESTFRMLDELVPAFARFGTVREPMGAETPTIVPHSHYQCADGSWVAIACSSDKMFQRLITTMGLPGLATHPEYATMQARVKNRDEINRMVAEWVGRYQRDDLIQICLETEIPCGPVNNVADIFADPHYRVRGNLLKVEHPEAGEVVVPAVVPRLSLTPGTLEHLGPHKGADTNAVLRIARAYR